MKKENRLLQGTKIICDRFDITKEQFYMFLKVGMPVRKINGRWYGFEDNINDFFKYITKGKPLKIPENDLPADMYEQ